MGKISKILAFALALVMLIGGAGNTALMVAAEEQYVDDNAFVAMDIPWWETDAQAASRGVTAFNVKGQYSWAYTDGREAFIERKHEITGISRTINPELTVYRIEKKDGVWYWEFPDHTGALIDTEFSGAALKIEATMFGKPVTKIDSQSNTRYFYEEEIRNKTTTSVIIPDSVTYIGSGAFAHMNALKNITLPNNPAGVTICTPFLMSAAIESVVFPCNVVLDNLGVQWSPMAYGTEAGYGFVFCYNLTSITFEGSSVVLPIDQLVGAGYSRPSDNNPRTKDGFSIIFKSANPPVKFYSTDTSKIISWPDLYNFRDNLVVDYTFTQQDIDSFAGHAFGVGSWGDYIVKECKAVVPLNAKANYVAANDGNMKDGVYFGLYIEESGASAAPVTPTPSKPDTSSGGGANSVKAVYTTSKVYVDGKLVNFDAYNINDNNYFKLRDIAYAVNGTSKQFEVAWDGAANAISLTSGKAYTVAGGEMEGKGGGAKTAQPTNSKILLNGSEVSLTAYNIDGNNYFKLRDLGEALGFVVDWDGANNAIMINTGDGYTPGGEATPPADLNMSAVLNSYSYSDLTIAFEWGEDVNNPGSLGSCWLKFSLDNDKADVAAVLIAGWQPSWTDDDIIQTAEFILPIWKQELGGMDWGFNGNVDASFPIDANELGVTTDVMLLVLNEANEAIGHIIVTVTVPARVS